MWWYTPVNPAVKEVEAGGSEVQSYPWPYSKFEASMEHRRFENKS